MDLREFWFQCTKEEKQAFADAIGCQILNVHTAYLKPKPEQRRHPSNRRIAQMVKASKGKLTIESIADYFIGQETRNILKEMEGQKK
ncbi:hypothetical protein [Kistimonas asteriae]|uniref:hypothetical protein n=1 Tax=Kistimonas asteriae TaxID=517724 RepID=UPI001BAAAB5A|nr:hypothetical protein [Kistimonas asteriae]